MKYPNSEKINAHSSRPTYANYYTFVFLLFKIDSLGFLRFPGKGR